MDEENNGALVRKPLGAVEKTAPGAKRILSGMVGETLAMARKQAIATSPIDQIEELERFWKLWEKGANYFCGNGVTQNYAEAVKCWRVAAEQGDTGSQTSLGECYENGFGVEIDFTEAIKWYRKAAERGNADATEKLVVLSTKISKLQ